MEAWRRLSPASTLLRISARPLTQIADAASLFSDHSFSTFPNPMYIATLIVQGLLGLVFFATGGMKLASTDQMVDDFERFGYPRWFMYVTGGQEVTGAAGLALGVWWPQAAVVGAGAIATAMIGAAWTHLARTDDPVARIVPPLVLGGLAVGVLLVQGGAL